MKKTWIIFILSICIALPSSGKKRCKTNVQGKVYYKPLYKGGARPTPEVLEACCKTRPLANDTLYIKQNYYSKPLYIITTAGDGSFSKRLRPGSHNIYIENKTDAVKARELAEGKGNAENAWMIDPYYVLEVKERNAVVEIHIIERMDPTGPLRP